MNKELIMFSKKQDLGHNSVHEARTLSCLSGLTVTQGPQCTWEMVMVRA